MCPHGAGKTAQRSRNVDNPIYLVAINVPQIHSLGRFILPTSRGLSNLPQCLVGYVLTFRRAVRPGAEENRPADTVEERAERLHSLFQLARRAFELDGLTFALGQEGRQLFLADRHATVHVSLHLT